MEGQTTKEKQMKMEVYVGGVSLETWFPGELDERQVTVLNCLDRHAHQGHKLRQTFDYTPSKEEVEAIDLQKLEGSTVVLGVDEIKVSTGGRLKFKGKIDLASVPKQAVRNGTTVNPPAKALAAVH